MIFLERLNKILAAYENDVCRTMDNARLYGVCDPAPPLAEHIVFSPMPDEAMREMVNNYKRTFPKELLELYCYMNGACLFWSVNIIGKRKIRIPFSRFCIYGIPMTYDRQHIEPINISIEDLNRPEGTPDSWLKFGSYYRLEDTDNRLDLFADTQSDSVYAVEHESPKCCVARTWSSVDECLCSILDLFSEG